MKQAAREAKLCARQLLHIQSPDLKFSGADPPEEDCVAAELCSPPDLRCLHLKRLHFAMYKSVIIVRP